MPKTLIVSYTPRTDSNTKKLLDSYLNSLPDDAVIDHLDLTQTPVQQHSSASINALLKRNFGLQSLDASEQAAVQNADSYLQRLLDCDQMVVAFPLYNFCVPAAIKAWLDAVIQKDRTFRMTEEGGYEGLCQGKKALILMTSGGDYSEQPMQAMNLATPLMQNFLGFMGITCETISAFGMDQYADRAPAIVRETQGQVREYAKRASQAIT